jgi:L-lactate dehydrogenase complex protein LldG
MNFEVMLRDIYDYIEDKDFREGVKRTVRNSTTSVDRVLAEYPELQQMAQEVREIKEKVLADLSYYLELTIQSIEKVQGRAYVAKTPEETNRIIAQIVGETPTTIVCSKSMVAEEQEVEKHLREQGHEVYGTDLGQFLVELTGEKPMHGVVPAMHLTRERAAALLKEKVGLQLDSTEPAESVRKVRTFLREKFTTAGVGISGANSIAADSATMFIVENEGNARLTTSLPPIHIAVLGIEKIMPTILDAFKATTVQAAYAGLYPPTYMSIIAGPSSTADIEYVRVYGAHGPKELHVIFVDNGRLRATDDEYLKHQLRCVRCGRCQMECPVWGITANVWGGPVYGGPMGVNWTAITHGREDAAPSAFFCLGCGKCDVVCPVEIPLSDMLHRLKSTV